MLAKAISMLWQEQLDAEIALPSEPVTRTTGFTLSITHVNGVVSISNEIQFETTKVVDHWLAF